MSSDNAENVAQAEANSESKEDIKSSSPTASKETISQLKIMHLKELNELRVFTSFIFLNKIL